MNDSHDPNSDDAIDKLLAPLRHVDCPEEVRRANRSAVEVVLSRPSSPPWWRRTVAVPFPLALAASLLLMVTATAAVWPLFGRSTEMKAPPQQSVSVTEFNTESPGWSVTRSYILSIESLAQMQNSFRPNATEERNET